MKRIYVLFTVLFLIIALSVPVFATKDILTSIHGRQIGLDSNGDLIVKGRQVTDVTASAGSTSATNTTETELHSGGIRTVTLTAAALDLVFTESGTASVLYGGAKVYDFPEGYLLFLGAVIDGSVTVAADTSAVSYNGDVSLGTVTADDTNTTLTSTEADLLISNALTQATPTLTANCDAQPSATQITESGALWIDGTATAKDMYLNFLVDDAGAVTTGTGSFTGTIEFSYIILGDN